MPKSQFDAVIPEIGGSKFTGYYIKGTNLKLSDGVTVINIWKPGCCHHYSSQGQVYKDAMIEVSGNNVNCFSYQDFIKIGKAVEVAIDYLNSENENLINREEQSNYEIIPTPSKEKKETSAIRYKDLQLGGIYLDEKKKKWLFLGKGTLLVNGRQSNSVGINQYSEYIYLKLPEVLNGELEQIGTNTFRCNMWPYTYSSKKRFFEKVAQLNIVEGLPITIKCGEVIYEAKNGISPTKYNEIIYEQRGMKM